MNQKIGDLSAEAIDEGPAIKLTKAFSSYLVNKVETLRISDIKHSQNNNNMVISATELDSHADSPVAGKHAHILETSNQYALVSGFTSELGKPLRVSVVTAAIAYECEYTGETYIMVIYNALYFKNMEVNLIPPIMMQIAGLEVD